MGEGRQHGDETPIEAAIREGLREPLPRRPPSFRYVIGLWATALVALALPVAYTALVAGVGYGVYRGLVAATALFRIGLPNGIAGIVYLAAAALGAGLFFAFLWPLFAGSRRREDGVEITRDEEPLLFDLIDGMARVAGAPSPRRVIVGIEANAAAGLRDGLRGLVKRELELRIGLTLATTLSAQALVGVLAHELGHFRQPAGLRVRLVVATMLRWLQLVASGRMPAAVAVWRASQSRTFARAVHAVLSVPAALVFGLFVGGGTVVALFARRMEDDADECAVAVAGSEAFAAVHRRAALVGLGAALAGREAAFALEQGFLPADLPARALEWCRDASPETRRRVDRWAARATGGCLSTHRPSPERIAAAERALTPPLLRIPGPATVLFTDLSELSRRATARFYESWFGVEVRGATVVSNQRFGEIARREEDLAGVLDRYLLGAFTPCRPLPLPPPKRLVPESISGRIEELRAVRDWLSGERDAYVATLDEWLEAEREATRSRVEDLRLRRAVDAGEMPDWIDARMERRRRRERGELHADRKWLAEALLRYEEVLAQRLATALDLLRWPDVYAGVGASKESLAEVVRVRSAAARLSGVVPDVGALELATVRAVSTGLVEGQGRMLRNRLIGLAERLAGLEWPFADAQAGTPVARYLLPTLPAESNPRRVAAVAERACRRFTDLYVRVVATLALFAERVEAAVLPDR